MHVDKRPKDEWPHPPHPEVPLAELLAMGGRTDAERLDWLEANDYPSFERWSTGWGMNVPHVYASLREAIDAEMEAERAK